MLRLKIKDIIDKSIIKETKRKIIEESFSYYKSTAKNYINTMWIYPKISNLIGSGYKIKDIALNELVAEKKITIESDKENSMDFIVLSDKVIEDYSHDYLSKRAFLKKYRSDIIALLSLLIAVGALAVSIIALLQKPY